MNADVAIGDGAELDGSVGSGGGVAGDVGGTGFNVELEVAEQPDVGVGDVCAIVFAGGEVVGDLHFVGLRLKEGGRDDG